MPSKNLEVGSPVVYKKQKSSFSPGPRAKHVRPSTKGDRYQYVVEKYWTVKAVLEDGTLTLVTRRGKEHRVAESDPKLRPAGLMERWVYRNRFPSLNNEQQ